MKQLQSVDILHFLKQSCAYFIKFLRSGHLLKMSMCHDATTRALIEFHALSGAGIDKFNVKKEQEIILADI